MASVVSMTIWAGIFLVLPTAEPTINNAMATTAAPATTRRTISTQSRYREVTCSPGVGPTAVGTETPGGRDDQRPMRCASSSRW